MYYSDNPVADFERWDRDQAEKLARLPVCSHCGEPIQDDFCFEINDELFCEDCMKDNFRRSTDNYITEEER